MLFSCKISNSVLTFLESKQQDLEALYGRTDLPLNFLEDPSCWLEADKMEGFLAMVTQEFGALASGADFLQDVGHGCHDLRAWGALDSVLRLMQQPNDIFRQPERLISYFISPAPPIGKLSEEGSSISFELPVSAEQYPLVTTYLRAAVEALPSFVGKPMATVGWTGTNVCIDWPDCQGSLFEEEGEMTNVRPKLLQTLVQSVEQGQQRLEEKNRELLLKNQELELAKKELEKKNNPQENWQELFEKLHQPAGSALDNVWRLRDYMARSQQLITLLVGQGRLNSQVQEAMRRVDWTVVSAEYPRIVKEAAEALEKIRGLTKESIGGCDVRDH